MSSMLACSLSFLYSSDSSLDLKFGVALGFSFII